MTCQIHSVPAMAEPLHPLSRLFQARNRVKRIAKRRLTYLTNTVSRRARTGMSKQDFQKGDLVRIRSREEIEGTLDNWNQLNKCSFMEEMWKYCGTTHRVLKKVEKFLDERDYKTKKCKGIILLDDVMCEGTKDFGPCDRSCFFFWRQEWLEKETEVSVKQDPIGPDQEGLFWSAPLKRQLG